MLIAPAHRPEESGPSEDGWMDAARALRDGVKSGFSGGAAAEEDPRDRRGPFRPRRLTPVRSRLEMQQVTRLYHWVDGLAAAAFALLITHLVTPLGLMDATFGEILPLAAGVTLLVWALGAVGAYAFRYRETLPRHLLRIAAAVAITGAPLFLWELVVPGGRNAMPLLLQWFGPTTAGLFVSHAVWWKTVARSRADGKLTPNIVIVGATDAARKLIETALKTREVAVLGVFDDRLGRAPKSIGGVPVLGDTTDLLGHKVLPYVDRIVIAVNPTAQNRVREIIARLRVLPNDVSLVLDASGEDGRVRALSRIADAQLAQVSGEPADVRRAVVKRLQDIVVGWTALILAAPVIAIVALTIKLDSPGPIFFRQRRHGFNNEEILVWKFRSMRQEAADYAAVQQVRAGDDRVTRVGKFIRATSLDELPQLFNVIGGEMSLVGPRPHAVGMKTGQTESARLVAEYAHRHRMKPGMTGWAAINGSRGPVDTPELVRRRVALDIEYIERQSFWFDLWIMAMTIPCLLGDRETVR